MRLWVLILPRLCFHEVVVSNLAHDVWFDSRIIITMDAYVSQQVHVYENILVVICEASICGRQTLLEREPWRDRSKPAQTPN